MKKMFSNYLLRIGVLSIILLIFCSDANIIFAGSKGNIQNPLLNENMVMNSFFGTNIINKNFESIEGLRIDFGTFEKNSPKINIEVKNQNEIKKIELYGNLKEVNGTDGSIGVYEGYIDDKKMTNVTLDLIYLSEKEYVCILTFGSAGGSFKPHVRFFGEFTSDLKEISTINAKSTATNDYFERPILVNDFKRLSVDGKIRLQKTEYVTQDNYKLCRLDFFNANEISNQGNAYMSARVASYRNNFENYLVNSLGYNQGEVFAYPDIFDIEVAGTESAFHNTGAHMPINNMTNISISPQLTFPNGLSINVPFSFTTSSTKVSPHIFGTATFPNGYKWEIKKIMGFDGRVDFKYGTENYGVYAQMAYGFSDTFTGDRYSVAGAVSKIRYEYKYVIPGATLTLHLWTNPLMCLSTIRIIP